MALDTYSYCPCGSGKKIKFCCARQIASELEKVERLLEAEQHHAALTQLDAMLKKKGDVPAALALKSVLLLRLGDFDKVRAVAERLLAAAPKNVVGFALRAIVEAVQSDDAAAAVEPLQEALENLSGTLPFALVEALAVAADGLVDSGHFMSARAHALAYATITNFKERDAGELLLRISQSPDIPILLRQEYTLIEGGEGLADDETYQKAFTAGSQGLWRKALEGFNAVAEKTPHPVVLRNAALMRSWLAQPSEAAAAWRAYARAENTPDEDAVEAELLAIYLDAAVTGEVLDTSVTYTVDNADALMERLLSDRRLRRREIDPQQFQDADEPAPKGVFQLLSKPLPTAPENLLLEDLPERLGDIFVYGKQTDRDARLEFDFYEVERRPAATEVLEDVAGDHLQQAEEGRTVNGRISLIDYLFQWRRQFPDDINPERAREFVDEHMHQAVFDVFPNTQLAMLDGKSPVEAAREPEYQKRVQAVVLYVQLAMEQGGGQLDLNELRTQLGLPTLEPIDARNQEIKRLPVVRMSRLQPAQLTDEQLTEAYQRALFFRYEPALRKVLPEVVGRESLDGKIDKAQAYATLSVLTGDPHEGLELLKQAQAASEKQGQSPAQWLIAELPRRLQTQDVEGFRTALNRLHEKHFQEPGVAEQVLRLLSSWGLVRPDGTVAVPRGAAPSEPPQDAEAPQRENKLWTPEGEKAAAGEKKLWLPGQD